jgi:hypothetical protein
VVLVTLGVIVGILTYARKLQSEIEDERAA